MINALLAVPLWVLIVGVFLFSALVSLVVGGIINRTAPLGEEDDLGYHNVEADEMFEEEK